MLSIEVGPCKKSCPTLMWNRFRVTGVTLVLILLFASCRTAFATDPPDIWIGAAKVDVTPHAPVVLAGYGSRTSPYEAIETKLWTRALVIGKEDPVVMVVIDNCGITHEVTDQVKNTLSQYGIEKDRVVIAATHTHNAPNLVGYAPILWQGRMTDEQIEATRKYTDFVIAQMVVAVLQAKKSMQRCRLGWGQGRVTFGRNRRVIQDGQWAGFGVQPDAPVDHSLPILVAKNSKNEVMAVWANYACHCTTIGSRNVVSGDWAGFANDAIEEKFPGSVSLVSIGTGADIGPQPTGNSTLAKQHGQDLGDEVLRIVKSDKLESIAQVPDVITTTVALPLEKPKDREHWSKVAQGRGFEKQLALRMLDELETKGKIANTVEYPISSWTFGDKLAIVFLPGEVVVDYSVRLKTELDWQRVWITAWSNRMPGYIPSRKVLMQGGYEAEFSQVYYGLPGRYKPEIENLIVRRVRAIVGKSFEASTGENRSPFHEPPSLRNETGMAFRKSLELYSDHQRKIIERVRQLIPHAKTGLAKFLDKSYRRDQWFNLYGDRVGRAFIRQEKTEEFLKWQTETTSGPPQKVYCFTGGLGWMSQPKSNGFRLTVNGNDSVDIDVVRGPTSWKSKNNSFELIYVPTWKSNEDTAGLFFMVLSKPTKQDEFVTVSATSNSADSQRWFGLDTKQNVRDDLSQLNKWLSELPWTSNSNPGK